jgi:hypothetical protein
MFTEPPPKKMNQVFHIIFVLVFLSFGIVFFWTLFAAIFGGKRFDCLDLLEELATKHQGTLCLLKLGDYSAVELPLSFGSMLVGVWPSSMLGSSHHSPRATINIESTSFPDLPEFMIHTKYSLSCGGVYGFKKVSSTDPSIDPKFNQKWCVFVRPKVSSQQANTLLQQLSSPLINLRRQALSPQWDIVNISYRDQKINFVYGKPIYAIDTLEPLMQASVEFVQALM